MISVNTEYQKNCDYETKSKRQVFSILVSTFSTKMMNNIVLARISILSSSGTHLSHANADVIVETVGSKYPTSSSRSIHQYLSDH